MSKRLDFGKTPWDDLSREELLRQVWRMFSALESADLVLRFFKARTRKDDPYSPIWDEQGNGGQVLGRISQIIDPVYEEYDEESVRSFFRYATSLLFDVPDQEKWIICPVCGDMWSNAVRYIGWTCSQFPARQNSECKGVFRWLEWDDLLNPRNRSEKGMQDE